MAAAIHRLSCVALQCTARRPIYKPIPPLRISKRNVHQSPIYRARKNDEDAVEEQREGSSSRSRRAEAEQFVFDVKDLSQEARAAYESLPPAQQAQWREAEKMVWDEMNKPEVVSELQGMVSEVVNELTAELPHVDTRMPKIKMGLEAMGEDEPQDIGEDEEYRGDDITSLAHGELEQHREIRHYARIAAWEMPLLSKLAKPFTPPPKTHPLRFRHTTYMGETHPAAKKIVLEFCTRDLPDLTEAQRIKLIKLVGVRYNPDTDVVKMSSEMFETQAQNKRYLGDLVDTLMAEARNAEDMFEDVPLDFRHHRVKRQFVFPEGWKLTERRRRALAEGRRRGDEEARVRGVVEGKTAIEGAFLVMGKREREEARALSEGLAARRGQVARNPKVR